MSVLVLPGEQDLLAPSRRRFLSAAAATMASMTLPAFARASDFWSLPRELWLYRPPQRGLRHAEQVRAVYWADGKIVPEGYFAICRLLRDVQRNVAVQFDLVTLDIARGVYGWLLNNGINRPLVIHSGYRDPRTNAAEGGKQNSYHLRAQALDLHIEGISSASVASFGRYLAGGGVGYYPGKNFTHLDRGRVKYWRG